MTFYFDGHHVSVIVCWTESGVIYWNENIFISIHKSFSLFLLPNLYFFIQLEKKRKNHSKIGASDPLSQSGKLFIVYSVNFLLPIVLIQKALWQVSVRKHDRGSSSGKNLLRRKLSLWSAMFLLLCSPDVRG